MKITKWALTAAIAATCFGAPAFAKDPAQSQSQAYSYYAQQPAPVNSGTVDRASYSDVIPTACACEDLVSGGSRSPFRLISSDRGGYAVTRAEEAAARCDEPWKLFQNPVLGFDVGGWSQIGYHTYNNTLFNKHADRVRLHQQWMYAERVADGSNGLGFGGRIDYLYGVDAQDTQAFGNGNNSWDNDWDNGIYGHSIPQLYMEAAYGDLSVKVGHFFTLVGYESVAATGNFFYSHSYTMYNSEPRTHTGMLAAYKAGEYTTLYGGYVMGWDSGFEDNGDAYLGGYSVELTDNVNFTNQTMFGRFGEDEVGFMSSAVLTTKVNDTLTHVLWADYLDTDGTGRTVERQTFDITNYFLVKLTDRATWGNRLEWYNIDKYQGVGVYNVNAGRSDVYAYTTGLNYAVGSNLLVRPEVRWDWDKDRVIGNELGGSQTTFGTDMVFTF